jgi:hypothetical protein
MAIRKAPFTSFVVFTLTLNAAEAIDNSKVFDGDPFQSPREAVEVATDPNSREYFSPEQNIRAPLTTVTASISGDGPVPPWDVSNRQLLSRS